MDAKASSRRLVTLWALILTLAVVLAWQFWPDAGASTPPAARGRATAAPPATAPDPQVLALDLEQLETAGPEPPDTGRDPFRFRPAAAPPPPTAPAATQPPGVTTPVGPPGEPPPAPPPPPITLKFIGLLTEGASLGKVAVLTDGRFVFHGREGDIIEGRYRVVRIGDESIQLEYADGRGRQTIRLSGS
jgi:hypothetical protein